MLKTNYVVLDDFSLVESQENGATAIFESKEEAEQVCDFLIREKVNDGQDLNIAEMHTQILDLVTHQI